MTARRLVAFIFVTALALTPFVITATQAAPPGPGASCADNTNGAVACYNGGCFTCSAGTWAAQPMMLGNTATACGSAQAGMLRWTGTGFQGCNGSSWGALGQSDCYINSSSFTNQTTLSRTVSVTSNAITLAGGLSSCVLYATCSGCSNMLRNGSSAGTTDVAVSPGQTLALIATTASTASTSSTINLTIGSTSFTGWQITTKDCSADSIGTACTDGSIYAGVSPDGSVPMYTTPCDAGQSGAQGSCTGTRSTHKWSTATTSLGYTSAVTGESNTTALAALGSAWAAAYYCDTLTAHGQTDWYLPAANELAVFLNNNYTISDNIGGFLASGEYWTSTEFAASTAYRITEGSGSTSAATKTTSKNVRCVRK